MVGNFPFYGNPASFQALELAEGSESNAFFDSINITDAQDDSDGDGLPDSWENDHFGNLDANPGDMASNGVDTVWATYITGLDPTSLTNFFEVSVLRSPSSVLSWNSFSGRVYSVYWTSNLLSGFGSEPIESNLSWTAVPYTDTNHPAQEKGFYKIVVEIEE